MSETTAAERQMDTANVAEIFHTALRKGVDGKASVLTWNLLYLMPDDVVRSFYGHMADRLKGTTFDAKALRAACLSWRDATRDDRRLRDHGHAVNSLAAALEFHPADDWASIASFVRHCGAAPAASFEDDLRSLWVDGRGLRVRLEVLDEDETVVASDTVQLRPHDGKQLTPWRMRLPGGGPLVRTVGDGLDAVPGIVDQVRTAVVEARHRRDEQLARPEAAVALEGFALDAPLDPADPMDARILELSGPDVLVLLRMPQRVEGIDRYRCVFGVPDDASPVGYRFSFVDLGMERTPKDKAYASGMQRWLEAGMPKAGHRYRIQLDDDLLDGRIVATVEGDELRIRAYLEKVGDDARVLSERMSSLPISFRPTPSVVEPDVSF